MKLGDSGNPWGKDSSFLVQTFKNPIGRRSWGRRGGAGSVSGGVLVTPSLAHFHILRRTLAAVWRLSVLSPTTHGQIWQSAEWALFPQLVLASSASSSNGKWLLMPFFCR